MGGTIGAGLLSSILAAVPTPQELSEKVTLDSSVLSEQFYFYTVTIMWLIHVGFMSYETGVARRKNLMTTAMKNILTIAVVTPTFYYFGWWIYGCFSKGIIPFTPGDFVNSAHASEQAMANFCSPDVSVVGEPGAEPRRPHLRRVLGGVPAVLVDDRIDHVGRDHRARAPLRLLAARVHPRLGDLDPRRLVGLERRTGSSTCAGASTTRSRASSCTASPGRSPSACC